MTKPKKPAKPTAVQNRETVGSTPAAASGTAADVAKQTSDHDEAARPRLGKGKAAQRSTE